MFTAVLDTNVLVPSLLRDTLLTLAAGGMYDPKWSPVILDELDHALRHLRSARGHPSDATELYLDRLHEQMLHHFPDASSVGWEHLEGTFGVEYPNDEHVVALAVHTGAGVIVTENLKDFPDNDLPGELHALSGADFICRTIEVNPAHAAAELSLLAERRQLSLDDFIDLSVMHLGLGDAVELVRPFSGHPANAPQHRG